MIKCLIIVCCILFIAVLFLVPSKEEIDMEQPAGQYIRIQDVMTLTEALRPEIAAGNIFLLLGEQEGDQYLSYHQYRQLMQEIEQLQETEPEDQTSGEDGAVPPDLPDLTHKYEEDHFILKEDWYQTYEALRSRYDKAGTITVNQMGVISYGENVIDSAGQYLAADQLLSDEGKVYTYVSDEFQKYSYCVVQVYRKENKVLSVIAQAADRMSFDNAWIVECDDSRLQFFYQGYEVVGRTKNQSLKPEYREQVADISFRSGSIENVECKTDKTSGKLIRIQDNEITIEGEGTYEMAENMKIYRLFGELRLCGVSDLAIGYSFADFVLDGKKICAALITQDGAMEYIRISIQKSNFSGRYHEEVRLTADTDCELTYGAGESRETEILKAGQIFEIAKGSKYLKDDQLRIVPKTNTGKITLLSVERSQGTPSYRGSMEIMNSADGLVVINEVLLEEYLYSVVPSEMPASYPLEALKAQAICARTYAYRHMLHSSLGDIGVHVDDSVAFQVYNNIAESAESTRAIKETTGQMLYYDEKPAGTYYYSTSCGYGTSADVWKSASAEDTSYIEPTAIGWESDAMPAELKEEEVFKELIETVDENDYEYEEAWYRWTYQVTKLDTDKLADNLKARYRINHNLVLTKNKAGEFVSEEIGNIGKVKDIYCAKRLDGGVMDELIIETTKAAYKVISENTIRYILNDGKTKVKRHDGSEVSSPSLLPSAFMVISPTKKNGYVTGYEITGGGYGHGVGMSQNGAKAMGNRGLIYKDILNHFYQGCEIKAIY